MQRSGTSAFEGTPFGKRDFETVCVTWITPLACHRRRLDDVVSVRRPGSVPGRAQRETGSQGQESGEALISASRDPIWPGSAES